MKAGAKKAIARTGVATLAVSGMSVAFPALAFAAEEESGGISAILPNMAEFVPMLVCFIILCVVLGKLGWPAFAAMLDKREKTIKDSLEKSEAARIESERVLEEYKQQLAEAKTQAALAELQGSVADTSIAVASRLIGNDLNDDEHRAIVERYVNEAGSFNAN